MPLLVRFLAAWDDKTGWSRVRLYRENQQDQSLAVLAATTPAAGTGGHTGNPFSPFCTPSGRRTPFGQAQIALARAASLCIIE